MKCYSLLLFLTLAMLTLQGCGKTEAKSGSEANDAVNPQPKVDTHLSLLREMTELMNEIFAIVEPVTDNASAKAAAEQIEHLQPRGESITNRLEALEQPPEEEIQRLEELTENEVAEIMRKIDEVKRIGSKFPELKMALNAAIPGF